MLLRTPVAKPTESLLGYALRVSETNGYDTTWHVFSMAGFTQGEILSTGFNVQKLAAVLGCSPEQLQAITYQAEHDQKKFQLLGHTLGGTLIYSPLRLKKPAICPHCVIENGFIDAFSDLSSAIACPIHGTQLLSHCPECNSELTWFRPGLLKCKCGARLDNDDLPPASQTEIDLMRLLYAKLHREQKPETSGISLPIDELWSLPLQSILELLVSIGNQAVALGSCEENLGRTEAIRAAARTLSNWPANFHEFLRRLDKHSNAGGISIRKRFGSFYSSMFKKRKNAADFTFLKNEMIRFGADNWGDGLVDHRMLDEFGESQRFMSRQKLAEMIAVSPRTLDNWSKKGKISLKELKLGSQKRFIADASGFSTIIKADGKILHEREAAKRLELPVSALRFLKASRHYEPMHSPPYKGGCHELDIKNFYQTILGKSKALEMTPDEPAVTLGYVMQEIRFWSKDGKGEFIAALLDERIENLGRLGETISAILFRISDVERFAQESRAKASDGAISLQEAGIQLGSSPQAIRALARDGYLEALPGPDRIRVTRKSVDDFAMSYVSLVSVAREHSSSTRKLHQLCMAQRIRTLRIPHEDSAESIFIGIERKGELITTLLSDRPSKRIAAEQALSAYLAKLKESGQLLPRRAGKPNQVAISEACNFERSVFYKNSVVSEMLNQYQQEERVTQNLGVNQSPSQALATFLEKLNISGDLLPVRGKRPNLTAISALCGFKRDCFYDDPSLSTMLDNYLDSQACSTQVPLTSC